MRMYRYAMNAFSANMLGRFGAEKKREQREREWNGLGVMETITSGHYEVGKLCVQYSASDSSPLMFASYGH
ncbi:hypothetical protein SNOG_13294 [Parastagonospora nodorum SN15]|uniref:Uncharacterized protein n=1 Tax=Phaeosphaeria nodorum (strain SN15 / ATCC MYA-4574 / FGSC 10173) TaxID=321614 RepID=Q0U4M0_PHANO|nr:hypothetical protein SNOG_13294 [Parastagonospora nodorum SN15]EAT79178.1 hypothetical protein SNOG_13294 [Parastagonospora nodorum SN15]